MQGEFFVAWSALGPIVTIGASGSQGVAAAEVAEQHPQRGGHVRQPTTLQWRATSAVAVALD